MNQWYSNTSDGVDYVRINIKFLEPHHTYIFHDLDSFPFFMFLKHKNVFFTRLYLDDITYTYNNYNKIIAGTNSVVGGSFA